MEKTVNCVNFTSTESIGLYWRERRDAKIRLWMEFVRYENWIMRSYVDFVTKIVRYFYLFTFPCVAMERNGKFARLTFAFKSISWLVGSTAKNIFQIFSKSFVTCWCSMLAYVDKPPSSSFASATRKFLYYSQFRVLLYVFLFSSEAAQPPPTLSRMICESHAELRTSNDSIHSPKWKKSDVATQQQIMQ